MRPIHSSSVLFLLALHGPPVLCAQGTTDAPLLAPPLEGPIWLAEANRPYSYFGNSVAGAGDVNGDGLDDLVVGAFRFENGHPEEGRAYLYFGAPTHPERRADWSVEGNASYMWFGASVSGAGDVNGDGFHDVLVGAPRVQSYQGRAFLYLGSPSGPSSTHDWMVTGSFIGSLGGALAGAGDVNGDGYDDILIGAYSGNGYVRLYFGSATGPGPTPDWSLTHDQPLAHFASEVAGAGDVNGDGFDDIAIGAPYWTSAFLRQGRALVFLGSATGPSADPDWVMEGETVGDWFGWSVAGIGDVDGDGFDDLVVGAPRAQGAPQDRGRAYLYLGSAHGLSTTASWSASSGLPASYDSGFGLSLGRAGDVNGDGLADLIVGARLLSNGEFHEGRAYLYVSAGPRDCNGNGVSDAEDIQTGTSADCNANGVPDECDLADGESADRNSNSVPDECEALGTIYCSGDGSGAACPCDNAGASAHGCANGNFADGAQLLAIGSASVGADDALLSASASPPLQPGLFFQGNQRVNGGAGLAFGDGLRCAGGTIVRLEVAHASASGDVRTSVPLAQAGNTTAGDLRSYQWWYRDPLGSPCGSLFNLTNAIEISWAP